MIEKAHHVFLKLIFDGRTARALSLLIFAFLISSVQPAFSEDLIEDFKLKKVGSRCEPEMDEWIAVPGRDMKAGSFVYRYTEIIEAGCVTLYTPESVDRLSKPELLGPEFRERAKRINKEICFDASVSDEEGKTSGVLVNNEAIYYPDGSYWADEMNFGFYKDYIVMDAWSVGASHNRRMFLYRLGENSVDLIDVIGQGYFDFMSVRKSEFRSAGYANSGIIEVADIDHDNNPELKLKIYWGYLFYVYLEIKDDHLKVDLNPELYRPLFEEVKRNNPKKKTAAYYIYGFLAEELKLDRIKEMVSANKRYKERHEKVVSLLENSAKWDEAFHDTEKFMLVRYDLKEAACNE